MFFTSFVFSLKQLHGLYFGMIIKNSLLSPHIVHQPFLVPVPAFKMLFYQQQNPKIGLQTAQNKPLLLTKKGKTLTE